MSEDTSQQGAVHKLQGGNTQEIGSTGFLDVYGELDLKSGAAFKLAGSPVYPDVESVHNDVSSTEGSTADQDLAQSGTSLLSCTGSTATATCIFRLPAPAANVRKTLIASAGIDATHDAGVETNAVGVTIGYAATNRRLAFDAIDEEVELLGVSATKWIITSNTGGVVASTNFTP